ncbi:MAG: tetratricopeptide repeat protein, partial [Anaerolineae bacterium]|nr:tetratricopeptide repeat protein [Anaerolineae bacterium]
GMLPLFRGFYPAAHPQQVKLPPVDIEAALALWDGLEERPEMGLPLTRAMMVMDKPGQIIAAARKNLAFSRRYNDLSGVAISLTTPGWLSCQVLGDFAEAQQFLEEALAIDREIGFDLNARWSRKVLSHIAYLRGQYAEAKVHLEESVAHHRMGGIAKGLDTTLTALGDAALELDEDVAAKAHFEESIVMASSHQQHKAIAQGHVGLGIIAAFQGDITSAATFYEDAYAKLRSVSIDVLSHSEELESLGFLALLLGHFDQALAHYEAILSSYRNTGYRVPLMRAHSRAGQALIGLDDESRATPYLFDALGEAMAMGALQVFLEALLGIAQLSLVPPASAAELLAFVGEHSASNRYSHIQAKHVLAMKKTLLSQDDFAIALQRGFALTPESAVALVEPFKADLEIAQPKIPQPLVDPLSQRELEVLVLIADGLTNWQIADQLYIGVSTVKKHINHIYSKLDVTHRAQAVARARTLNFLS